MKWAAGVYGFLLVLFVTSCTKNDNLTESNQAVPFDSGVYFSDAYIPLKLGIWWKYKHDNGIIETVRVSELKHY